MLTIDMVQFWMFKSVFRYTNQYFLLLITNVIERVVRKYAYVIWACREKTCRCCSTKSILDGRDVYQKRWRKTQKNYKKNYQEIFKD